jgi:hypothetical protein
VSAAPIATSYQSVCSQAQSRPQGRASASDRCLDLDRAADRRPGLGLAASRRSFKTQICILTVRGGRGAGHPPLGVNDKIGHSPHLVAHLNGAAGEAATGAEAAGAKRPGRALGGSPPEAPPGPRPGSLPPDVDCPDSKPALVSKTLWSMIDLAEMVDAAIPKPRKRGDYKK